MSWIDLAGRIAQIAALFIGAFIAKDMPANACYFVLMAILLQMVCV
jgi:hypothetical protein